MVWCVPLVAVLVALFVFSAVKSHPSIRHDASAPMVQDPFAGLPKSEFAWERAMRDMLADEEGTAYQGAAALGEDHGELGTVRAQELIVNTHRLEAIGQLTSLTCVAFGGFESDTQTACRGAAPSHWFAIACHVLNWLRVDGCATAAEDLALMQEAARATGKHAVAAWQRLSSKLGLSAKSRAMATAHESSQSLPPSRLECSCRFMDEANPFDNPPDSEA